MTFCFGLLVLDLIDAVSWGYPRNASRSPTGKPGKHRGAERQLAAVFAAPRGREPAQAGLALKAGNPSLAAGGLTPDV